MNQRFITMADCTVPCEICQKIVTTYHGDTEGTEIKPVELPCSPCLRGEALERLGRYRKSFCQIAAQSSDAFICVQFSRGKSRQIQRTFTPFWVLQKKLILSFTKVKIKIYFSRFLIFCSYSVPQLQVYFWQRTWRCRYFLQHAAFRKGLIRRCISKTQNRNSTIFIIKLTP